MSLCAAVKWKVSLLLLWYDPLDYCISSPSASEHVQEPVFPAPSYECIGQRRGSSCESRVSSSPLHSQFCERIDRQRTGTRQHCIMKTFIFWKWEKKCVNDHKSTLIVAVHTMQLFIFCRMVTRLITLSDGHHKSTSISSDIKIGPLTSNFIRQGTIKKQRFSDPSLVGWQVYILGSNSTSFIFQRKSRQPIQCVAKCAQIINSTDFKHSTKKIFFF